MIFFTKNPNLKNKKLFSCVCVGGGGGGRARVSVFFYKESKYFFWGVGGGVGGRTRVS